MKIDTLVIATRNAHKTVEIRAMLDGLPITVRDLREFDNCSEVEEDGLTLEANALKKAVAAHECTGLPVIADDTGLEVDFLQGEPGVRSARFAGENADYNDNNRLLLERMSQVFAPNRQARFRCVVAFIAQNKEFLFEGKVEGDILTKAQGSNGFGYDPIFRPAGYDRSYAELSTDEKNAISHRALAIAEFHAFLKSR